MKRGAAGFKVGLGDVCQVDKVLGKVWVKNRFAEGVKSACFGVVLLGVNFDGANLHNFTVLVGAFPVAGHGPFP